MVFRSTAETFAFCAVFCVSNGLGATASAASGSSHLPAAVRFDYRRIVDKKQKSCKAEHFAMIRYRMWTVQRDALASWQPQFDPENADSGVVAELKIGADDGTIAAGSVAEVLSTMRVGAQKLLVISAAHSVGWASELGADDDAQSAVPPIRIIFVELTDVSKKRKLKKKKESSKRTTNADGDDDAENENDAGEVADEPSAAAASAPLALEYEAPAQSSQSSSAADKPASLVSAAPAASRLPRYSAQAATLDEVGAVIAAARDQLSAAIATASRHAQHAEKRCIKEFRTAVGTLYAKVSAEIGIPEDFDEDAPGDVAPIAPAQVCALVTNVPSFCRFEFFQCLNLGVIV